MATEVLDARGLSCPLPVLRARKVMQRLARGDTLSVLATDPAAERDFEAYCDATGHELLQSVQEAGEYRFLIRKSG